MLSVITLGALYWASKSIFVVLIGAAFSVIAFLLMTLIIFLVRKKLTAFSDALCGQLDAMLAGRMESSPLEDEEGIFYKINHRLTQLFEVLQENQRSIAKERSDLQELISDISHQVKTPIANLKMIDATLLEQSVSEKIAHDFLTAMDGQIDKLDFLMQAMIKTSRLETGVITLEKKKLSIYNTLAAALGGILLGAEKKDIHVTASCPEELEVYHDRKWTSEALFNILDNAVKYTAAGGSIDVSVESWEMYLKIEIADTGKGIAESKQGAIFKRFFREEEVHDIDGIGIGLYLAREIITMQGGYIKVVSAVGKGSTFSVFLPRK
ncbi:MAG: sensor histidine kinase [Eubacteriaceae bacterium]